ncbi:protein-tyrosine phosphatase-like protein [Radiomyces spectabilis]|uniref:protein-tyrosine phosphatase-like protein n=1 Tax=Radiomyces spectabilis TaxID=64574 RepID=UPI00221F022D|nr:protein-tyrosine phosphatase-like protein [Radiomyces spectabilis]KAI8378031.1 protein-tyrosine phosphatase-like protein [Radiomyces spectabilis]
MLRSKPRIKQQRSSLGISHAVQLEEEVDNAKPGQNIMSDDMLKEPSERSSIFGWARFMLSLYYNKVYKLAVNLFGCITGWSWYNRIDQFVYLGALPTPSHIKSMHANHHLCAVVNMCAEFPGYHHLYKELSVQQIRLATTDFTVPSVALLREGVEAIIRTAVQENKCVYLHCKAGRGRSAAVAICYLLRMYKITPLQAQQILLQRRPQVDKDLFQTDEVRMYYKEMISDAEAGKIHRQPYHHPAP